MLSPDAPEPLLALEPGKVYCIGGIVDRSVCKGLTLGWASDSGVTARRLPVGAGCGVRGGHAGTPILGAAWRLIIMYIEGMAESKALVDTEQPWCIQLFLFIRHTLCHALPAALVFLAWYYPRLPHLVLQAVHAVFVALMMDAADPGAC
jgi:hypothetical protein